tara:strand:- start:101 stop:388 length:288 start_codon:yes stop_codon:yes gene_type:complete
MMVLQVIVITVLVPAILVAVAVECIIVALQALEENLTSVVEVEVEDILVVELVCLGDQEEMEEIQDQMEVLQAVAVEEAKVVTEVMEPEGRLMYM